MLQVESKRYVFLPSHTSMSHYLCNNSTKNIHLNTVPNHNTAQLTQTSYSCNGRCGAGCTGTAIGNA
jgi:hypothetical protein